MYQEVYIKEQEAQREIINYQAWLQGQYQMFAIGAVMSKKCKYPAEPFDLRQEQKEQLSGEERFKLWVNEFNRGRLWERK